MAVKLITDSTSDIDRQTQAQLDITVIPLSIHFPDESFIDGQIELDYFYQKLKSSPVIPTSSQPPQGKIQAAFEQLVAKGHDIVAIFLSSKISGTYETALAAKKAVLRKYSGAKIAIFDSLNTAMAVGYPVIEAAKQAQAGKSFTEIYNIAQHLLANMRLYFIPATFEYMHKGGRIGGAAALMGSILDIKPVLYFADGVTSVAKKVRTMRRAIRHMLGLLEADAQAHGLRAVIVQHISNLSQAQTLAKIIRKKYGLRPPIVPVGPIVGLHSGPGVIAVVYCLAKDS